MPSKGLLLISGGIDSPVAGYLASQSGLEIAAIHFSQHPFTDNTPEEKSRKLLKTLGIKQFYVVNLGKQLEEISRNFNQKFYFVLMKRMMLKISEKLAKEKGYDCLITGESLAQVSSQTLTNLSTISKAVAIPIVRPLLAVDKEETITIARKLGTFETSKGPELCDALGPKHPSTQASEEKILEEENKLGIEKLIDEAFKNLREEIISA